MSENQSRNPRDLSRYDAMTTQQLQELLRLDSESPNNGGTDTEELLQIMEVLADRNKDSFCEKAALEAWEAFQQDYLNGETEEPDAVPAPQKKSTGFRRWLAAAAVIALLIGIPITVSALNREGVWNAIVIWAGETFSFGTEEIPEDQRPSPTGKKDCEVVQQALISSGNDAVTVPAWVPERYALENIEIRETPKKTSFCAIFHNVDGKLTIKVDTYDPSIAGGTEANEGILEVYEANGVEFYIVRNQNRLKAMWLVSGYQCYISGEVTIEEMRTMIDSIGQG